MKKTALILCVFFLLPAFGGVHASLVGDTIHGSIIFTSYTWIGNCFDPSNPLITSECNAVFTDTSGIQPLAMVSEDDSQYPEFLYSDTGSWGSFLDVVVDVDSYSVHIDIIDRSSIPPEQAATPLAWTIALTDLDWNPQASIIGADVTSYEYPGGEEFDTIDPFVTSFGQDWIDIDFVGREGDNDDLLQAWIDYGHLVAVIDLQTNHVPIPSAVLLLGSGLIGIVGIRRKFRK